MAAARSAAESGLPAAMASRAASTNNGWGRPVSTRLRASVSTDGGLTAPKRRLRPGLLRVLHQIFRSITLLLTCAVGVPVTVTSTILAGFLFLPLPATLPPPKSLAPSQASHVYDAAGNEIATFREFEQNIPVKKEDIPKVLKDAVISVEDKNFYKHGGVDIRGSLRALVADLRHEQTLQGGSTITQQYVKNAYTNKQRTLVRKVREAVLASQ